MPQNVYLVPGFLSTQLFSNKALQDLLWVNNGAMVFGYEGYMRLAPDGLSPGPPDGIPLYLGGGTPEIWPIVQATLQAQLGAAYNVRVMPWDWRMLIENAGFDLATIIAANDTAGNPCTIIGHSAGGLVAQMAWSRLTDIGLTSHVRRIVSLLTPFQGSYYGMGLVDKSDPAIEQLINWNAAAVGLVNVNEIVPPTVTWTWQSLFNLFATFPAFYELFPALLGPLAASDPDRKYLYTASNYPAGYNASQNWLDHAQLLFQPRLFDPGYQAPLSVQTCVSGYGQLTTDLYLAYGSFANPFSFRQFDDGDGVVQELSAILPRCRNYRASCDHYSMPLLAAQQGWLKTWILDPPIPPTPVPPPDNFAFFGGTKVTQTPPTETVTGLVCIGGG